MDPAAKGCLDGGWIRWRTISVHQNDPRLHHFNAATGMRTRFFDSLKRCKCPEIKLSQTWHDTGLCECDDAFPKSFNTGGYLACQPERFGLIQEHEVKFVDLRFTDTRVKSSTYPSLPTRLTKTSSKTARCSMVPPSAAGRASTSLTWC